MTDEKIIISADEQLKEEQSKKEQLKEEQLDAIAGGITRTKRYWDDKTF